MDRTLTDDYKNELAQAVYDLALASEIPWKMLSEHARALTTRMVEFIEENSAG